MQLFGFDKETLVEELKKNPKWKPYWEQYKKQKRKSEGELWEKLYLEDCTGCCNPSSMLYVLADTEEQSKEMIFKCEAGMCADCIADWFVEDKHVITKPSKPEQTPEKKWHGCGSFCETAKVRDVHCYKCRFAFQKQCPVPHLTCKQLAEKGGCVENCPDCLLYQEDTVEEEKAALDCVKAVESQNCQNDCDTCPYGKILFGDMAEFRKKRAIEEHRQGVGAGEVRIK